MNEIIEALFNRLTDTISDDYGIYDHVPQDLGNSNYPFLVISPSRADNVDTNTETGFSVTIRILGHSRYRGFKELMTLADSVGDALNNWDMIDTATYRIGTFKEQFRTFLVAPDGLTRNSVQEFIFYYEPI